LKNKSFFTAFSKYVERNKKRGTQYNIEKYVLEKFTFEQLQKLEKENTKLKDDKNFIGV
jgi:hypothetical protein